MFKAAYNGDPAAKKNYGGKPFFCIQGIVALTHFRIAHELA